jgi:hypothetical protein
MSWIVDLVKQSPSRQGMANLYGVIIYTDVHAYTKKVLKDDDFWEALHEISGPQWVVFATRAIKGYYDVQSAPPGTLGMMRMVWKEANENKELLSTFEMESTAQLPVVVVFAQNSEGQVYKNVLSIDDSSEENAFKSIKGILSTVAAALEDVASENLQAGTNVFHAVGYSLKGYKEWQMMKKGFLLAGKIKSWLP